MIDATHEISSIRRTLGTRTLDAGEARVMTITRTYAADVDDVWEALTSAERLARWFLPVSGELRLGGRYRLEGNAEGTVERCDPPKGFAATWEFGGGVSWIEVGLASTEGGTRFELEHVAHIDEEFWTEYGPGAAGVGWDLGLLGLGLHLADPAALVAERDPEWMASAEARQFVALSSDAWYEASVAAGTDEAAARAAADRTTAFYSPAPDAG